MASERKSKRAESQAAPQPANDPQLAPLEAGRAPDLVQAAQSPALALQAQLHRRVSPRRLEMTSRFVTLFFVVSVSGLWLATSTTSLTV